MRAARVRLLTPSPRFDVSRSTVQLFVQLAEADDLTAKPSPGRPRQIGPDDELALRAQLVAHADATLAQHCQLWADAHGVTVSQATMCRAIQRLGC